MQRTSLLAVLTVAACAQSPETIPAAYVPDVMFHTLTCPQLGEEQARVQVALTAASQQQEQARSNDIAGVILLGLPMGSMSGQNVAPVIAQLRGTQEALTRAGRRIGCATAPVT